MNKNNKPCAFFIILNFFLLVIAAIVYAPKPSYACDFCGIYTPLVVRERQAGQFNIGVRQDLLGYSKSMDEGSSIDSRGNHKIFVTEITSQYSLSDRLSVLAAVPLINSRFRRDIDGISTTGSDSGIGDVAVYADLAIYRKALANGGYFQWDFFAGAKLPTGDNDRIAERNSPELSESGLYGGAVSVGTGSVDVPLATGFRRESNGWLMDAMIQYNIRTEGDDDYKFGNDLRWEAGLGKIFSEGSDFSFSGQFFLSGISNDEHEQNGVKLANTERSLIAVGPKFEINWFNRFLLMLRAEIPVSYDNDGIQTLRGHRVSVGLDFKL